MEQEKLIELRKILEKGWNRKTALEYYSNEDPMATGQCYITARTLNYIFNWELIYYGKKGYNHYWNRLPNGEELDFTSDQMQYDGIHITPQLKGLGKPRTFKPIDQCKGLNPRLKAYLKVVKADLLAFRDGT